MRILLLAEGDPETHDSWSGITKSLIRHLRLAGHEVIGGDVDLYGLTRYLVALRTFHWRRGRWRIRFRLGAVGFAARTAKARRIITRHCGAYDVILQVGATFRSRPLDQSPVVLYCDSNIELSRIGADTGQSEATQLTESELEAVRNREHEVYIGAALILTLSEKLRSTFVERFAVPNERVTAVYAGPNTEDLEEADAAADLSPRDPIVLFAGKAFDRKGGDVLLKAFAQVRKRIPEARLEIIGPQTLPGKEKDLPEGVVLHGYLDKSTAIGRETLQAAYRRARVFCLPTRFEPFGIVFIEAMQSGLPCIGPSTWAVPEIIDDGVTGILVNPNDQQDLERALERLLVNSELAVAMGRAGRDRMRRLFTWPRVVARISGLIEGLTSSNSAR